MVNSGTGKCPINALRLASRLVNTTLLARNVPIEKFYLTSFWIDSAIIHSRTILSA
jgi:hypothetical protein